MTEIQGDQGDVLLRCNGIYSEYIYIYNYIKQPCEMGVPWAMESTSFSILGKIFTS